jgi:hypothetical protein
LEGEPLRQRSNGTGGIGGTAGTTTDVQVRAEDPDDGPLPLMMTLRALSARFADAHAPDTVYACGDPGLIEICADASDGACVKTACVDVSGPAAE